MLAAPRRRASRARQTKTCAGGRWHRSRGEQLEVHAAELFEALADGGQPHLPGDRKRRQICVSHEFAGRCRVPQQFPKHGIDQRRFGRELQALVLDQLRNQVPCRRSGNGILPHNRPIPEQTHQRQLHEAAQDRFSRSQPVEPAQRQLMVFVVAHQQRQQDVDVSQTWLHRFAPASVPPCEAHGHFRSQAALSEPSASRAPAWTGWLR